MEPTEDSDVLYNSAAFFFFFCYTFDSQDMIIFNCERVIKLKTDWIDLSIFCFLFHLDNQPFLLGYN